MFEKIGFFHFGRDWRNPIEALQSKLESTRRAEDVANSLIVLPEAFNIGKGFWEQGDCNYDASVLAHLGAIAVDFQVAFVAGLSTYDDRPASGSPYNSAYLIDRGSQPNMCEGVHDGIKSDWARSWVVLANSNPSDRVGSFVSRMGEILEPIGAGPHNRIILHPMHPVATDDSS
jgi:hypothetical protein